MTNTSTKPTEVVAPLTRDEMRARIMKGVKPKSVETSFNGVTIELRQPTVGEILDAQEETDRKRAITGMMVRYAYVPDTDERVFEMADLDALMNMPFGDDYIKLNEAINKLTGINVAEEEKNLS